MDILHRVGIESSLREVCKAWAARAGLLHPNDSQIDHRN